MICRNTTRGVGSFLRAIEKKLGWLPTMATHWAKQLSLSKAMSSDQDVKKISTQNNKQKNCTSSSSLIFFSEVLKDANQ
jgi:hypothetical protein